ncbi:hypothetical protein [Gracilimonas sediminicola]|uniref:hypothetical protein n=1 Tax=Gracilimonas sediminicola TaxID=2952158 RepID=UPI0038D3BB4A
MSCNYLYIDDEEQDQVQQYVDALHKHKGLNIDRIKPGKFEELIDKIIDLDPDGILIDWKLDGIPTGKGQYKAGTVAQELRTRSVENEALVKPIILISTDEKLQETYTKEGTSHDLFDFLYKKNEAVEKGERVATELIGFAKSYNELREHRKKKNEINEILELEEKELLDSRIYSSFSTKGDSLKPVHEYAQFIINHLIRIPGPLIDEKTLASRIGINIDESKNWKKLREEHFDVFKFSGPFSGIWDRWWAQKLESWWYEMIEDSKPLQLLKASERIEHIKEKIGIEFTPCEPIEDNYGTEYWTICQVLGQPLDPVDGFMIESSKQFPWQEELYVSKKSVIDRTYKAKGYSLHPMENERYYDLISDDE